MCSDPYGSHSSGLPAMTCTEVSIEATQVDFSPWLVLMYPWKHCPDVILLSISYRHNKCLVQQGLFYPRPLLETDIAAPGKIVVWLVAAPNPSCGLNANFVTQMSPFPGHCFTSTGTVLQRSPYPWTQKPGESARSLLGFQICGEANDTASRTWLGTDSLERSLGISCLLHSFQGFLCQQGFSYQQGFP